TIDLQEPDSATAGTSVGIPVPGVEVGVLDAQGMALARGEVGQLAVRSPAGMCGYVGGHELNKHIFHGGFFKTGDLGYVDPAGVVYLAGRMSRVINLAGVKVDPVEVEQAIEALDGVASCYVDSISSSREGEVIRARVVTRNAFDITRRAII